MLNIVPRPGICFKKIHKNNTNELMIAVDTPMDQSVFLDTPCANTVHGLTPTPAAISNASPKPKRNKPKIRNKTEIGEGLIVKVVGELQNRLGITLILNMFKFTITHFAKLSTFCSTIVV